MNKLLKVNLLAFCTVLIWASAFPITKIAMSCFSPSSLSFLRCTTAAIILFIIGTCLRVRRPFRKKDVLLFIISGGAGFALYMIFFNNGLTTLTSATSSIIIAVTPILTAIAASFKYKEKITPIGYLMILLSFAGVLVLLLWDGVLSINSGIVWTLCASFLFCIYNMMNRRLSFAGYTAVEIVTYSMFFGTILLSCFSVQGMKELIAAPPSAILSVVYLGMMPSAISYLLWGKALSLCDRTSQVTNYMFVTPLLSTIIGFMLLREVPNAGTFIGGGIIILSVIGFNLKGK